PYDSVCDPDSGQQRMCRSIIAVVAKPDVRPEPDATMVTNDVQLKPDATEQAARGGSVTADAVVHLRGTRAMAQRRGRPLIVVRAAALLAALAATGLLAQAPAQPSTEPPPFDLQEATISDLQAR